MEENNLRVFNSEEFGSVRSIMINGEPYFVARDVSTSLGYTNPQKAVRDHVDEDDRTVNDSFTVNGTMGTLINESGLYSLILSSKLPSAKRFKRWVTSVVLPTIRQTGNYQMQSNGTSLILTDISTRLSELEKKINAISNININFSMPKPEFNEHAANAWKKYVATDAICNVAGNYCNGSTVESLRKIYDEMQKMGFCESAAHIKFESVYGKDSSTLMIVADNPIYQNLFMIATERLLNCIKHDEIVIDSTDIIDSVDNTETIKFTMSDDYDKIIHTLAVRLNDNHPKQLPTLRKVYAQMYTKRIWKSLLTREHCKSKKSLIERSTNRKYKFLKICNGMLE